MILSVKSLSRFYTSDCKCFFCFCATVDSSETSLMPINDNLSLCIYCVYLLFQEYQHTLYIFHLYTCFCNQYYYYVHYVSDSNHNFVSTHRINTIQQKVWMNNSNWIGVIHCVSALQSLYTFSVHLRVRHITTTGSSYWMWHFNVDKRLLHHSKQRNICHMQWGLYLVINVANGMD